MLYEMEIERIVIFANMARLTALIHPVKQYRLKTAQLPCYKQPLNQTTS